MQLPRLPYRGNSEMLGRVWMNLIDNAIKFSHDGGTIFISGRRETDRLLVTVRDEGIGIRPEALGHIFDKFYQGEPSHASAGAAWSWRWSSAFWLSAAEKSPSKAPQTAAAASAFRCRQRTEGGPFPYKQENRRRFVPAGFLFGNSRGTKKGGQKLEDPDLQCRLTTMLPSQSAKEGEAPLFLFAR